MSPKNNFNPNQIPQPDTKSIQRQFGRLIIEAGMDLNKVSALEDYLATHPGIFEQVSMLVPTIQKTLMMKTFGDNEALILVAEEECRAMIAKHTNKETTALEKLLIERISMCWLKVNYAELALMGAESLKHREACDRGLDRAQARFIKAIESLAKVRVMIEAERVVRGEREGRAAEGEMRRVRVDDRGREGNRSGTKQAGRVVKLITGKSS